MKLAEAVRQSGVVGAGGAGFPTHVKVSAKAEWFLANGAECEPLLHKDRELMVHFADEIVRGLHLGVESVGAKRSAIGVKTKNAQALASVRKSVQGTSVEVTEFGDFYPSGDEYEVVYSITGRLIPPAGIPLEVGVVVNNVETLYNIQRAAQGIPVTETFLTVGGMVKEPATFAAPVGTSYRDLIEWAGGVTAADFTVMESGLMMGRVAEDLSKPVTKTTSGLVVLPSEHPLVKRYQTPPQAQARIGKSACDQCSYCTELCPRYLLGYDIQPHAVMRSLGFTASGSEQWNRLAQLCCGCGLCTLYACPESLFPREACLDSIKTLRAAGLGKWQGPAQVEVHPMKEYRRVPMKMLLKKLGIEDLEAQAPLKEVPHQPSRVDIPLKQHVGVGSLPVVGVGDRVSKGQLIAAIPEGQLGATVHASISGKVTAIAESITIEKD